MRWIAIVLLACLPCAGCTVGEACRDALFGVFGDSYSNGTTRNDKYEHYHAGMADSNAAATGIRPRIEHVTPSGGTVY